MAHLKQIPFQSEISSRRDDDRNSELEKGIVLVETTETQAVLSKLPSADVDRLADALNKLLDVLNAKHAHEVWSWHLALTVSFTQGGEQQVGGPGKSPERKRL
ncbi:MAG: hypothetical protein ABJD97_05995 [Betaproteobacteria bacterium]